jgi:hypothetical protein
MNHRATVRHEKVTVSVPAARLARARAAVAAGAAASVSAYVDQALAEKEERLSLDSALDAMDRELGRPSRDAEAWARRVLGA